MRVADLFSGCGGLSRGLEEAGLDVVIAIENWPEARRVYEANFKHPALDLDIAGVNAVVSVLSTMDLDAIVGGPPCQDFSAAGIRSEGVRAQLTVSFAEVVSAVRPSWFLLENVPEIRSSTSWAIARGILRKAGYGISECVLNAAYFGVPQLRKRFFAVGRLEEDDHFLDTALHDGASATPMTVRDLVGDTFGIDYYYRHPRNWGRRAIYSIDEPSATIRSTNRPVPPGYDPHPQDRGDSRNARPLVASERARIQTFPTSFRFIGTATDRDMMIANAVPVALAKHVGAVISTYEKKRSSTPGDLRFRTWLVERKGYTTRTASNILSRVRRVGKILRTKTPSVDVIASIASLRRRKAYLPLSSSVKSQLKRALVLKHEFGQSVRD